MQFDKLLDKKKVVITGGSHGLGKSICKIFAAHGAQVAFTYKNSPEDAKDTLDSLIAGGCDAKSFRVDVTDQKATAQMFKVLEKEWGQVDILVNNAGILQNMPFVLLNEADWDNIMDVNVKGTFLTTQIALRGMIKRKSGVILNIGSLAGVRMVDAPVHYYTSKAAIKGFTESLGKSMARYQIRVLCLAPGMLEGGVSKNLPPYKIDEYKQYSALGRIGKFKEVAEAAAFLASDLNTYMSGETIVIDGSL